jgi:predicted helicase
VFLTNTLDLNASSHQLFSEESALSNEGEAALEKKLYEPFTVIIGNPPYGRDTQTDGSARDAGDRTGGVMRHKSDHFEYPPIQDFLSTLEEAGVPKRRGAQVYNLYAYFWRWSIWQTLQKDISRSGSGPHSTETKNPGIVAFITSASFISADSFAGMRDYLRGVFDEIFVIDLGGSSLIGGRDPNIFPIQTPVAICIGLRTKGNIQGERLAGVKYVRIEGTREQKLEALSALNIEEISDGGQGRFESFAKEPTTILSKMENLDSYFEDVSSACLPGRTWVVSPSKDTLQNRWDLLLAEPDTDLKNKLLKANSGRTIYSTPRPFSDKAGLPLTSLSALKQGSAPEGIIRYSYRPYDHQWIISDMRLIGQPSKFRFMRHEAQFWLGSGQNLTHGPSVVAYKYIPDFDAFRGFGGGKDFFPAFSNPTDGTYNLSDKSLDYLKRLGVADEKLAFLEYIYAIHGSGAYTEAFSNELRLGTSRAKLPVTSDKQLFRKLSQVGSKLLSQHLSDSLDPVQLFSPKTFEAKPAKVTVCPAGVTYDTTSEQVLFDGKPYCAIPSEIWNFSVGTMKVVQAFLKNRQSQPRGRRSSPLDDINDTKWIYNEEFVKMIADVSAVIEAKKLVMPLLQQIVEELEAQPGK